MINPSYETLLDIAYDAYNQFACSGSGKQGGDVESEDLMTGGLSTLELIRVALDIPEPCKRKDLWQQWSDALDQVNIP